MTRLYAPYCHVELDFSTLTDADRHTLVQNVKAAAVTSSIFLNSPMLQTLLGQLVAQDGVLATANTAVPRGAEACRADREPRGTEQPVPPHGRQPRRDGR